MPTPGDALELPPGYGFSAIPRSRWFPQDEDLLPSLMDRLLIWEKPRKTERYVVSVDVAGGTGLDRSVIEVLRVGTLKEPDEEVAQFVSDSIDAVELAYYIDPIGRYYQDAEGQEALVAVEFNGMGGTTQSELLHHLGYTNLYIWQHEDARDPRGRYSRAFGWYTNSRTRPMMLQRLFHAVTTLDERTGLPDFRINSPFTMDEMRDFQAPPGYPLWKAEAFGDAHDDAIMAAAIAVQVAQTLHFEGNEPVAEQRRRLAEEKGRKVELADRQSRRVDYISSDCTADEMMDREENYPEEYAPNRGLVW
jgi:hypothetical protein